MEAEAHDSAECADGKHEGKDLCHHQQTGQGVVRSLGRDDSSHGTIPENLQFGPDLAVNLPGRLM